MTRRLLATGFVLASLTLPALAQRGQFDGGPGGHGGNRVNFLTGYLSLTDAQKTQATTIFDAARAASETARGQLTSARDALTAGIKAGQTDAQLDQLAAAVGTIEGQLTAIQAKAQAKFYALLTAEQKTKYDQLLSHGAGRR